MNLSFLKTWNPRFRFTCINWFWAYMPYFLNILSEIYWCDCRIRPLLWPDSSPYAIWLSGPGTCKIELSFLRKWHEIQFWTTTLIGDSVDDFPFISWLAPSVDWISFRPQEYRQTQSNILLTYSLCALPPPKWKLLWPLTILPDARIIYFRFMYNKLHCNASVSRFDPTVSDACSLCHGPLKGINYMLINCSFKWSAWQGVLSRFAPYFDFRPKLLKAF